MSRPLSSCPLLLLAPMESLGDFRFRRAIHESCGGFDECCTEFIRVPNRSDKPYQSAKGVVARYDAFELGTPIGCQLMGGNPELLAISTSFLFTRGRKKGNPPRVDLNCGCPANTVTGNGAGSSLLKTPQLLFDCVKAMVTAADGRGPVTVKMRSGFEDTSLFEDNLLAAQEAGASFVTIHPRTKRQTYNGRADWELIARAVELLDIPVVGNGDLVSVDSVKRMRIETKCHAVMIGRGSVSDPLLFHRIRHSYNQLGASHSSDANVDWSQEPEMIEEFLRAYASSCCISRGETETEEDEEGRAALGSRTLSSVAGETLAMSKSTFFGKMKKIIRYLFSGEEELLIATERILRCSPSSMSCDDLVELLVEEIGMHWKKDGPSRKRLINHMDKTSLVL